MKLERIDWRQGGREKREKVVVFLEIVGAKVVKVG